MKGKMELIGMHFNARIGCLEKEKECGNEIVVDLCCEYEMGPAIRSDALEDACDYSALYEIVRREIERSANLLENAAGRIKAAVCRAFPSLTGVTVSVSKKNPPLDGEVEWSKITI